MSRTKTGASEETVQEVKAETSERDLTAILARKSEKDRAFITSAIKEQKAFSRLFDDLKEIIVQYKRDRKSDLKSRHEFGQRINEWKAQAEWGTYEVGLYRKLHEDPFYLSKSEIQARMRFAEKYPDFTKFVEQFSDTSGKLPSWFGFWHKELYQRKEPTTRRGKFEKIQFEIEWSAGLKILAQFKFPKEIVGQAKPDILESTFKQTFHEAIQSYRNAIRSLKPQPESEELAQTVSPSPPIFSVRK